MHELLEMIGELEDERRWARLREGALWAVLIHALLLLAIFLLPKYVWVPRVIQPKISANDQKDWTYLDSPSVPVPRPPKLAKPPQIDRKTLDDIRKSIEQPPAPAPQEQAKAPGMIARFPSASTSDNVRGSRVKSISADFPGWR